MSLDYNQSEEAVAIPNYYVYTKATWGAAWTLQANLIPLSLQTGANAQSVARLAYHIGSILREETTAYATVTALSLIGHFCMIETFARETDGSDGDLLDRWIGIVEQDDRAVLGEDAGGATAVDQVLTVFGMERLLDARAVRGSWVMGKNPKAGTDIIACRLDTPLIFNAPGWGTTTGQKNRHYQGATHYFEPADTGGQLPLYNPGVGAGFSSPSAFGMLGDDSATNPDLSWNLGEVLNYLLAFFAPVISGLGTEDAVGFRLDTLERMLDKEPSTISEKLLNAILGDAENPASAFVYGFSPEGKTVFECLNELCTPARGLGWTMLYTDIDESAGSDTRDGLAGPTIAIFSLNEDAITVGASTLPATPLWAKLNVTGRQDVHYAFSQSGVYNYGRIKVQGERILSCFTLSGADGSLDKGWTSQEETAYVTPPGLTLPADYTKAAEFRARSRVWREFVVKAAWDFKSKNGENSGTPTVVNPIPDDDGTLIETPASLTRRDKRFEDFIPIAQPLPEGATVPPEPLYDPPRLFVKWKGAAGTLWIDPANTTIDEAPVAAVRPLDDRFGLEIVMRPLGRLSNDGAQNATAGSGTLNWSELILTAAMRTERRVSYAVDVTGGDPFRELVIDVPGAELWLVAPNTVTGIDAAGALVRTGTDLGDSVVRDDRDRLKQVATFAQAWYGHARRGMVMNFESLTYRLPDADEEVTDPQPLYVGLQANVVVEVTESSAVDTVIWTRSIDFMDNRITYQTLAPGEFDYTMRNSRRTYLKGRRGKRR